MTDDIFADRRRALEEAFFSQRNQELLSQLRAKYSAQQDRERLAALSGIQDEAVLDRLLGMGIHPESFLALSLIPLILLAWADDFLDPKERHLILKAADSEGIRPSEPAYELINGWLSEPPSARLLDAWKAYIAALKTRVPAEQLAELRDQLLGRARRIARAAGGLFGVNSVTSAEKSLLDQLELAFA